LEHYQGSDEWKIHYKDSCFVFEKLLFALI